MGRIHLLALFACTFGVLVAEGRFLENQRGIFDDPHCFLTLNEKASVNKSTGELFGRELELNWQNFQYADYEGHWVGLFIGDPAQGSPPLEFHPVDAAEGYIKTGVRLEPMNFTSVREVSCLQNYWIGYFRPGDTTPVKSSCIRLYPKWMNDLKGTIGNKKLRQVMTPGTHDAGAWIEYDGTFISDGLLAKFTYTQEENIYNQLVSGIRYIDVRVAYYPNNTGEVFWVCHGDVRIRELKNLLQDVLKFVQEFKEVVYMDFHGFERGFASPAEPVHALLYDYVRGVMEPVLAPKSLTTDVTFNQLWNAQKYVLWTYNDNFNQQRDLLWPNLQHAWGDKNKVPDLLAYLPTAISQYGCSNRFWSAMAELTPGSNDIITNPNYGLRNMAADVNKPIINQWYKKPEWYSRSHIVSTDFYMGNDLIQTCVDVNRDGGVIC